jgi:hypothetical protein
MVYFPMGSLINIRQVLLEKVEDETLSILYNNDPVLWEKLLLSHRINDRIKRIKDNIGFPRGQYNDSYNYTRYNNLRYRDSC